LFWWDDVEAYFLKATSEYYLDRHLNFELMSQNRMRKTKFEYHLHRDTKLFFSTPTVSMSFDCKVTTPTVMHSGYRYKARGPLTMPATSVTLNA
jgi:hypothetical protein